MKDENASQLLTKVMGWSSTDQLTEYGDPVSELQMLGELKYDSYQRYAPGMRFIENLALWLNQFTEDDRPLALDFVRRNLVFISEAEMAHLVEFSYPDIIYPERQAIVAAEQGIPSHHVGRIANNARFKELEIKSLYLGLSDGARTDRLRRTAHGEISNEQIWQAYELGNEKAEDMIRDLKDRLKPLKSNANDEKFSLIWLIDDFSASGNTYIRYDFEEAKYKGKIPKIYKRLQRGDLVDTEYYEVFLLLYITTRQAIEHIEFWSQQYAFQNNLKPIKVLAAMVLEEDCRIDRSIGNVEEFKNRLISNNQYYDVSANDKHIKLGGTTDAKLGFAGCSLPLVLSHNTPNNSIYALWAYEHHSFRGLFPRVSRHKEY